MISSRFKILFVLVTYLAIYFCSALNNAPKNKETCDRKSVKSIVIKTSNQSFAGTDNFPKITMFIDKKKEGCSLRFDVCSTNQLDNPILADFVQGQTDIFDSAKILGTI